MVFPIIMICVCILLGGGMLFYTKFAAKGKAGSGGKTNDPAAVAANEFLIPLQNIDCKNTFV